MHKSLLIPIIVLFHCCAPQKIVQPQPVPKQTEFDMPLYPVKKKPIAMRDSTKLNTTNLAKQLQYDTLIPIYNNWFITYGKVDYSFFIKTYKSSLKDSSRLMLLQPEGISTDSKKWGIVDSLGNIILPFIADAIFANNKKQEGYFVLYSDSYSLNTGIPRYMYKGKQFHFLLEPQKAKFVNDFSKTIQFISDFHYDKFVIEKGPLFYLPFEQ